MPPYLTSSGTEAIELAASVGLELDDWQKHVLIDSLGEREDGQWAAFEVGLIVPRQNGKGAVVEARELAGMFLFGEKLILHSAHEFKDLDIDTAILTTTGWSTMGQLVAGDEVFAPDGQPTKVLAAHPVLNTSDCYRVTMADGQSVVAGSGHLWAVTEVDEREKLHDRVVTTAEIAATNLQHRWARSGRERRVYRWRIALPEPIVGEHRDLAIDPYLLGMWLGDGTTAKGELTVGAQDLDHVLSALDDMGEKYRIRPDRRWPDRVSTVIIDGLAARLRAIGMLGDKRIPEEYLTASIDQRCALLAGIMDTDGTVSGGHQLAVTMVKESLMSDVVVLVRSLGRRATLRTFRAQLNGADAGPMFRVQFPATADSPFRLERKTAAIKPRAKTRSGYNAIVSVEKVPTRPTRCITVAHESACYLVGRGFLPTHNTAAEAFRRILGWIENSDDLRKRVKKVMHTHGAEGIELLNGARLHFVARSKGSGRGFSGDLNVLDEAFALTSDQLAALLPTMSARPNPQLWYTSTPPLEPAAQLVALRKRGMGEAGRLAYFEWSPPEVYDPADRKVWQATNPAMGIRIAEEFVQAEYATFLDAQAEFKRERLGEWPPSAEGQWQVIREADWRAAEDEKSKITGQISIAIDVNPTHTYSAVAVAGRTAEGMLHVEVIEHKPGTGWVVDRIRRLVAKWRSACVVVDAGAPAGSLIAGIEETGIEVVKPGAREVAQACGQFFTAVSGDDEARTLRHIGQGMLTAAVAGAIKRPLGNAWAWDRRGLNLDICPLVAATLAAWGYATHLPEDYDALANIW